MTTENAEITELRRWLDENEGAYLSAQKVLRSPKKTLEWLKSFQIRAEDVMRFDPFLHPASAAVGVICAAKERFAGVFEDLDFLQEYEDRKERWQSAIRAIGGLEEGPADLDD